VEDLILDLTAVFKKHQPQALTVLKVDSALITQQPSDNLSDKEIAEIVKQYDFFTLSIASESNFANANCCSNSLIARLGRDPDVLKRAVFELETRDRITGEPTPAHQLAQHLRQLQVSGARNFGYSPDEVSTNQPTLEVLRPLISLKSNPNR
jgi:biofilm PGA synthesis lipoprotein PgaB